MGSNMFFSRKKQGFKNSKNILRRFYLRFSGFLPLVAVFALGIFGSSVYYKNLPANITSQQSTHSTTVEVVTRQLNNEKDITDSLSSKNVELKQQLKEALSKASSNDKDFNVTKLNSELDQEKQANQKLNDENARLKVRINNILAKNEVENNISKNNTSDIGATTVVGRNIVLDGNQESAKSKTFNKVKMDLSEVSQAESKAQPLTSRNTVQTITKTAVEEPKKILKSKSRTMKLKKGESLWNLSKRAYGKGIFYKKIIKANPSITENNFKKLRPGTKINIPL
jgi:nucleoid-associated protein YgaU